MSFIKTSVLVLAATLMVGCASMPSAYTQSAPSYNSSVINRAANTRLARVVQVAPVQITQSGGNTGTLIGALVGGLIGKQVGHGAARDVATGIGVLLGGHAGTRVQNASGSHIAYEIVYQDIDNRSRRLQTTVQTQALVRPGDLVFVSGYGRNVTLSPVSPAARAVIEGRTTSVGSLPAYQGAR